MTNIIKNETKDKIKAKIKDFTYRLQAFGLFILSKIFILLGINLSSFLIGTLFVIVGPLTPPSFLALKNIKKALPETTPFQRFRIILGMWNNLGRNLAEFVGIHSLPPEKVDKYINIDEKSIALVKKIQEENTGGIVLTAHFGNWEALSTIFLKYNIPCSAIYRNMNNKYADDIVLKYRGKNADMIPKGKKGVLKLVRSLKENKKILMLVDQKLNNGISVSFFGMPSKTTDAPAIFALKNNCKLYFAVVFRRSFSCFFDIKIEEFEPINTGNFDEDVKNTTIKINEKIEQWIRVKPEQWFWVHNRWKDKK